MPPDDYIATPVGEGLLLGRRNGHRLFALNETARFLWERRADGVADGMLPNELAAAYGIDLATAERDVQVTLRQWRGEGLLDQVGPAACYVVAGHRLQFRIGPKSVHAALAPLFAPFAASEGQVGRPELAIEVIQRANKYVVAAGEQASTLLSTEDAVIESVMASVVRFVFAAAEWRIALHSAAAACDGACVLLPGQSGSGKTTLLAHLLARGLDHVTDDLALIMEDSFAIQPLPLPLVLKRGSWGDLTGRLDGVELLPVFRRLGQDVKYWLPANERIARSVLPIKAIVFPRFSEGQAMATARLGAYEAVAATIQAPTRVGVPLSDDTVQSLASWSQTIPAYSLTYGRTEEAAAWVETLLRA